MLACLLCSGASTAAPVSLDGTAAEIVSDASGLRLCLRDGLCARLRDPNHQQRVQIGLSEGTVRLWDVDGYAPDTLTHPDGEACEGENCQFPSGYVVALFNEAGGLVVGRADLDIDTERRAVGLRVTTRPQEPVMIWLETEHSCGGECLWWHTHALRVDTARSGYTLHDTAGPLRIGVQDGEVSAGADGQDELCLMSRRSAVTIDPETGHATVVHDFELTDEEATRDTLVYDSTTRRFDTLDSTNQPAPELVRDCAPVETRTIGGSAGPPMDAATP
jgi:hypothetical protein